MSNGHTPTDEQHGRFSGRADNNFPEVPFAAPDTPSDPNFFADPENVNSELFDATNDQNSFSTRGHHTLAGFPTPILPHPDGLPTSNGVSDFDFAPNNPDTPNTPNSLNNPNNLNNPNTSAVPNTSPFTPKTAPNQPTQIPTPLTPPPTPVTYHASDRDYDPKTLTDAHGITKSGIAYINKVIDEEMDQNLYHAVEHLRDAAFENIAASYQNRGQEFSNRMVAGHYERKRKEKEKHA